ncbi:protelomerase family protein (plasmid) [Pseudomonas sp. B26140]|uniref:protelomerase family protein n=1 Tax=Pseudomonas sp. B26140 TaxID=3235112 RepID=UPI0037840EA8
MAGFGNRGGQTRQKVELQKMISELITDIEAIDADQETSRADKTRLITRRATRLKKELYEDRRRKASEKLAPASYRRYLTIVRKAVTAKNWHHHSLAVEAARLGKKFPRYAEALESMASLGDITAIRLAHRDLLNQVKRERHDDAHQAISTMKLDHEVMRHLTLPAVTAEQLADDHVERLEVRATNTIEINYHWLMDRIAELLSETRADSNGVFAPMFSSLALGLAFATGRREVEVLALGRFKKVGDFEVEFSGQAKRREGIDHTDSYRIYTLIPADAVVEAMNKLRALPEVLELQDMTNVQINQRVAKTLNTLAKRIFDDPARVFRDSRSIWARLVFELHFNRDDRWKKVNESVFWRSMLGHEDVDTQEAYKQFKIDYTKPERPAHKFATRLEALGALDKHAKIEGRRALERIHEWVKATVKANPGARINQNVITQALNSNRANIKEYLALADEALATPDSAFLKVHAPSPPSDVARAKPHLVTHKQEDGSWLVVASVNGVEAASAVNVDRLAAMREAFTAAGG